MNVEIKGAPSFSYMDVTLEPGETIVAESDAMASMSANLDLVAKTNEGILSAAGKRVFGKESFFISYFKNNSGVASNLVLTQAGTGEIRERVLDNEAIYFQRGAFIARTEGVKLKASWAGVRSMLGGEGLIRLKAEGSGSVWYGSYGSMVEKDIDGELIVDTNHLVSYEPGINIKIQLAGGLFSSVFSGEGLVMRLEGKGKVVLQTRSINGLASWLNQKFIG
ncbi:MAG: TIGR00266 family protein [Spirochaetales bacterium]|nr:TIGR00266 family protein [Spirochaetales bacterium]